LGCIAVNRTSSSATSDANGWEFSSHFVNVGDLQLHYLDARRGDALEPKRTALMIHGMTSHADSWRGVIPWMNAIDRCVCPDLRGHGESEWTRDGYWIHDYADDMVKLLDELGVASIDVIGGSFGARVAMVLAPRLAALRSVSFVDAGPEVDVDAARRASATRSSNRSVRAFRDEEDIVEFWAREHPTWDRAALRIRAQTMYYRNWVGKLVSRGDPEVAWLFGPAGLREVDDMWRGLRETTAPCLVIRAKSSYLLNEDVAQRMCEAAPNSTFREIDCSHYIIYERPETLANVLDEFLRTT
jgi:pimeloyl-ACP methyl ester carboxylesterase